MQHREPELGCPGEIEAMMKSGVTTALITHSLQARGYRLSRASVAEATILLKSEALLQKWGR